jgi:ABC-2 type transport system ATP-binding protein
MNKVQDMNTEIADLSLHPNTLEDVFIELTGTSLRE